METKLTFNHTFSPMQFDATILVGDRGRSRPIRGRNKNFLEVNGLPLFFYALQALEASSYIKRIYIVGDTAKIKRALEKNRSALREPEKVFPLEQKRNLFENAFFAFETALETEKPQSPSAKEEKAMLYVPGDVPLLSTQEVNEFIEKSDMVRYDYCLGVSAEDTLQYFYPKDNERGIKLAYFYLREKKYRQNNLHLIKPLKVKGRHYIQKMYDYRYQKSFSNFYKLLQVIMQTRGKARNIFYYVILHWNFFIARFGLEFLTSVFRKIVGLENLEKAVGILLGCNFAIIETQCVGAALDIDNETDYETIKDRFDHWKKFQDHFFTPSPGRKLFA